MKTTGRKLSAKMVGDLLDYTVSLYMWFIKQCCQQLSQAIGF